MPEDSVWKQIEEFPTYWISQYGQFFNMRQGHLVQPFYDLSGVRNIRLYDARHTPKRVGRSVAKLVRIYFGEDYAKKIKNYNVSPA